MTIRRVLLLKNKTTPVDPYQEEFFQSGYTPDFIPLLDHIHLNKEEIALYLQSPRFLEDTSSFIITSQRAVEVLNETMLQIDQPQVRQKIFSKPAYTVGPATAKILSDAGFQDIRGGSAAGNGTILSDIIINDPFHVDKMDKEILFFTGEIHKDILPKNLLAANFNLVKRIIYKTVPKDGIVNRFHHSVSECEKQQENWIVFFSPQGTENIVQHIRENLNHLQSFKIASIGPTTETYLLEQGIVPDIVLKKPEASSLTKSISSFKQS